MRILAIALAILLLSTAHAAESAALNIVLKDGHSVELSPSLLAGLTRQQVVSTSHGKTAKHEGYNLREILKAAGVDPVEGLRGKQLAGYLTVTATDGYTVVFALAELYPTLGNTQVVLADSQDGQPLHASDGPWRLVVPGDQRAARSVRQVTSIRVSE